jgi:D-glycero-D-manno-heptose 1,7-bisphosphate phosphatase
VRAAIFLDRDGVITENRADYVKSWTEVVFLPGVFEALRWLSQTSYRLVIVTNQSAVGRGIITLDTAHEINQRLVDAIQGQGGRIDSIYLCPHHPDAGCECRKPRPGLLFCAATELGLDLTRSYLVGDGRSDMEAARAAGVQGILVLTGRGVETVRRLGRNERSVWPVVADLKAAVEHILNDDSWSRPGSG